MPGRGITSSCHLLTVARRISIFLILIELTVTPGILYAEKNCVSISHKPVKLEAWVSKRYEKDLKNIRKEFAEMGNTVVGLFVYPAENPSRIVAIGRCVPAYIARHILAKAGETRSALPIWCVRVLSLRIGPELEPRCFRKIR